MQRNPIACSEYNRDQWTTYQGIFNALRSLPSSDVDSLKEKIQPYLAFRSAVDNYQSKYFLHTCERLCFQTQVSACCGFESIIMFFADHVVNALFMDEAKVPELLRVLTEPNRTQRCIYLGVEGCLWKVRPISCAMFLCSQAKGEAFARDPKIETEWEKLMQWEKEFTWPVKPVLFDDLEKYFINLGVQSPHMYFHQSPGLLKVKARAGL